MKKNNFDLDDDELKATKDFLGSLGKLFMIILYLLCILMEKINLLIIPIALFDLYWIGKEFYNCVWRNKKCLEEKENKN